MIKSLRKQLKRSALTLADKIAILKRNGYTEHQYKNFEKLYVSNDKQRQYTTGDIEFGWSSVII